MTFKDESNGTSIMCIGSVDQEIFDKGILAVFEGLISFCHDSFAFDIKQSYRAPNFLLNELYFEAVA
jgi:hypothetical protein